MKKKLVKIIIDYWISEETNIFKNYKDAVLGFFVLILIPVISGVGALTVEEHTFWNYTFPLLSISLAGMYDTYGRYEGKSPRNIKLGVRVGINSLAIFCAGLYLGSENLLLLLVSPLFLVLNGMILMVEIYNRIRIAVLISPWGLGLEE